MFGNLSFMRGFSLALVLAGCTQATPSVTSPPPPATQTVSATPSTAELKPALQQAIASYMKQQGAPPEASDRLYADYIDLNGDGMQDAVVILSNSYWCGTGGCNMLILEGQKDKTLRLVSESSLVRPPVTVMDHDASFDQPIRVGLTRVGTAVCSLRVL
jgi:hypothetical protein